jgi:hypothetical protein
MSFTKLQLDEIIAKLEIRQETIEGDIESADEFEAMPGALEALKTKLEAGSMDFTEAEKKWMRGEFNDLIEVAYGNMNGHGKQERLMQMASVSSCNNALDKLK